MKQKKDAAKEPQLRRYLIAGLCAACAVALISMLSGFGFDRTAQQNLSALCDGFFVSGILIGGIGAMVWVSTTGFFDILAYGFKNLSILLLFRRDRKYKRFYDYKAERDAKRQKPQFFLLGIGLILLAIAGVILCFYSSVQP